MHPCAAKLDEALGLIRLEESALAEEDVERAETLAEKRAVLIFEAWQVREGYAEGLLIERMEMMRAMQTELIEKAQTLLEKLGGQMATERKQAKYFDGYRHAKAQAQKSFYCDRRS